MLEYTRKNHRINFSRIRKVRDIIKLIEKDGWVLDRHKGSHRHYKHAIKRGVVTVAGQLGTDISRGTRNSILKQAGLKG